MNKKTDSKRPLIEEMSELKRNSTSKKQLEKEIIQFLNESSTKEGKSTRPG